MFIAFTHCKAPVSGVDAVEEVMVSRMKTLEEGCRWDAQGAPSAGEVSQPGQLLRQEVSDDEDRAANCRKYEIMTG